MAEDSDNLGEVVERPDGLQTPGVEPLKAKKLPDAKTDILSSIQQNMFCDAALQNIGYIVLGKTIMDNPEFNNPERFVVANFRDINPVDADKYELVMEQVTAMALCAMLSRFDETVKSTKAKLETLLNGDRIVIGTLRMMTVVESGLVNFYLLAVKEK